MILFRNGYTITGNDPHERYPKITSPQKIVSKIQDMALDHPRLTKEDLLEAPGISLSVVSNILKKVLGSKKPCLKPHALTMELHLYR